MGEFYESDEVSLVIYQPIIARNTLQFTYNSLSLLGCIILPPESQHQATYTHIYMYIYDFIMIICICKLTFARRFVL